jgi:nitrite reductase/ring-hydroxylating ferredoxin subunit/uncharacterized membrane protein
MATETALDLINRQDWLDPVASQLQQGVHQLYQSGGGKGQAIKNALHGTWLGHPVHAVITDVPVGAWTAGVVCDALEEITGRQEFGKGADLAVGVGLAGAAVSAITGLTDWSETDGRARKIGFVHGAMNLCGALLYTASLACRNQNKRRQGRGYSLLGYAMAFGAAYLGGELVYNEQVGVNHAAGGAPIPTEFVPVLPESDLQEGILRKVDARGVPVLLLRRQGEIYAIAETCSHAGAPLSQGKLEGTVVTCPWHKSQFDLRSGNVINGPATHPEPCFETRVRNGQVEVRLSR